MKGETCAYKIHLSEIASKLFVSKKVFAINKQRYEIIPFLQFFAIMEYVEIVCIGTNQWTENKHKSIRKF